MSTLCQGIEVRVQEARNMRSASTFGLGRNDLYITLAIDSQKKKTTVKNNAGKAAKWNESFTFAKSQIRPGDTLRVRGWDSDVGADDKIGGTIIELPSVVSAGGHIDQWFVLYVSKMGGKVAGEVKLSIKILKAGTSKARRMSAEQGKQLFAAGITAAAAAPAVAHGYPPVAPAPAVAHGYPPAAAGYPGAAPPAAAGYPGAAAYPPAAAGYPGAAPPAAAGYPGAAAYPPAPAAVAAPPAGYPGAAPGYPAMAGAAAVPQVYAQRPQQPQVYMQQPQVPQAYAQAPQVVYQQTPNVVVAGGGKHKGGKKNKGGKKHKGYKGYKGHKGKFGKFGGKFGGKFFK